MVEYTIGLQCQRGGAKLKWRKTMLTGENKQWILANVAGKEWTLEEVEGLATPLLTLFWTWASPLDERVRRHSAVRRAFDADMERVKDRVKKVEEDLKKISGDRRSG